LPLFSKNESDFDYESRTYTSDQSSIKGLIRSSLFVLATIVGFIIFGIYLAKVYDGLRQTTDRATENSIWVVGQIEPNSLQFKIAMDDYLLNPEDPSAEQRVKVTAGILMSRMDIVKIHIAEDRLAVRQELVKSFDAIFAQRDKLLAIASASDGAPTLNAVLIMQRDLNMFIERIRAFAVKIMRLAADMSANERAKLWSLVNGFALGSFILVLLLVGSMFMMILSWNRMVSTRAKEAEARESLQKTYDLSSEGILIVDRMARILTVNPAASAMFDLTSEDLENENFLSEIFFEYEDPKKFTWDIMTRGRHGGIVIEHGMTYRTTTCARRKDGTYLDLDLLVARDRDSRGRNVMVLFLRDITEQKAREAELREARDKAVRAVESRIRFFAAMSHEMRTPISGAIAAIDAINVRTKPTQDQKRLLRIAEKSANGALDQINNVLDLAWVERGDFHLDSEVFNYADVIEEAVDQFRPLAQSFGTVFELELEDREDANVKGPLRVFMRPLNNLLGNAIKHTQNGTITVRTGRHKNRIRIEVEDTGSGISESDRSRIFEPFIMGSSESSGPHKGSGLGLPIAKRAVESMGGEIGFSSKPGYGTLFWFTCELEAIDELDHQTIARLPEIIDETDSLKQRVLLVEDDEASRILGCEMLQFHGLDVTAVENGKEAFDLATEVNFPTILMDVNMPLMDGIEATAAIRKSGASAKAKIIGVTAFGAPDEVERFLACGMDQVMNKPLTSQNIQTIFGDVHKSDIKGVEAMVGKEKVNFALDSLRTEVKSFVAELKSLKASDDTKKPIDDAHRIKGLAALLQYTDLAEQIAICERHLKEGRVTEARILAPILEAKLSS